MDFKEAMAELELGKKIKRHAWGNDMFLNKTDNKINCYREEVVNFPYTLETLASHDWIVEEVEGEHSFTDALVHVRMNRKIRLKQWAPHCYVKLDIGKKQLCFHGQALFDFVPTIDCLYANDWTVIE